MNSIKLYINKYSYIKEDIPDLSFIPMLMRRKLDKIGKAGLYTLYNSYSKDTNYKLVFASCYGDVERVCKLITQKKEEGEISPTGFSFSVHNATIGLFSLLNGIKSSYNSISAGNKTIEYGFLEAILTAKENRTLFCYAESHKELKSLSIDCSNYQANNDSIEIICEIKNNNSKQDSFDDLIEFLNGNKKYFFSNIYTLTRT